MYKFVYRVWFRPFVSLFLFLLRRVNVYLFLNDANPHLATKLKERKLKHCITFVSRVLIKIYGVGRHFHLDLIIKFWVGRLYLEPNLQKRVAANCSSPVVFINTYFEAETRYINNYVHFKVPLLWNAKTSQGKYCFQSPFPSLSGIIIL